jgi:hypothetical protein
MTKLPRTGPDLAHFLPHFGEGRIFLRMSRVFSSLSPVAALFAVAAFPAVAEPVGVSVSEFPAENAALIAATQAYFDEVEGAEAPRAGKRPAIIGLPLTATKASVTLPDGETAVLKRMGPVRNLTGYNITWYPVDRLLGTVDFMGTWDGNRNLVCGYLTWNLDDPSDPELVAVEANYVSLDDLKDQPAVEIHRMLLTANCAFGAIDENYAFFDVAG